MARDGVMSLFGEVFSVADLRVLIDFCVVTMFNIL